MDIKTEQTAGKFDYEDDVIQEMDVYISKDITDLYLLQFPFRQEELPTHGIQARFKSQSEVLELLVPVDTTSEYYSAAKDKPTNPNNSADAWNEHTAGFQHLNSSKIPLHSNYFAGLVKDDKFFMVPLQTVIQMKPSLRFTANDQKAKPSTEDNEDKSKALQVQFRKKESQAEIVARLKSYAHLQKLADEEAWASFDFLDTKSTESQDLINVITLASANTSIPVLSSRQTLLAECLDVCIQKPAL